MISSHMFASQPLYPNDLMITKMAKKRDFNESVRPMRKVFFQQTWQTVYVEENKVCCEFSTLILEEKVNFKLGKQKRYP